MSNKWMVQLMAVLVCAVATFSAIADTVKIKGLPYPNTRVINIKDGKLFVVIGGTERSFDLLEVESIVIDRYPKLEDADRSIKRKQYDEALQTLEELSGTVREDYMKFWVNAKIVYCLNQSKRYDEALTYYLKVVEYDQSKLVEAIMPSAVDLSKEVKAEAVKKLKNYATTTQKSDAKALIGKMVEALEADMAGKKPTEEEPKDSVSGAFTGGDKVVKADPVQKLIDAKKYEEAHKLIETELKKERAPLIKLLMQRAEAEAGLGQYKNAALSYLRVPIHFPRAQEGVKCYLGAGDMLMKLKSPQQALKLWERAKAKVSDDDKLEAEIDKRLASIKK